MFKDSNWHKNKCQKCYQTFGRFIMDCYCLLCQRCFGQRVQQEKTCRLCKKNTRQNFIDIRDNLAMKKMGHLFQEPQVFLNKLFHSVAIKNFLKDQYTKHLQKQLMRNNEIFNKIKTDYPQLTNYIDNFFKQKNKKNKINHSFDSSNQSRGKARNNKIHEKLNKIRIRKNQSLDAKSFEDHIGLSPNPSRLIGGGKVNKKQYDPRYPPLSSTNYEKSNMRSNYKNSMKINNNQYKNQAVQYKR